ncbi:PREDICTED: DCN1-like protein 2 [Lupinus angustifolius]|uniref:DCN1-like protein 2 n=1 Tax=Lupinus angustifolius TaxID=3871 RepID=UPI00092F3E40|nr:PREDICTED: DCN1-like protein 2 [Lupinus angustifolius]
MKFMCSSKEAYKYTLLCNDIQVDHQDIVMLVISWHMKAGTMCEFTQKEFIDGLQSLGVDSLEKFREKIPYMRSELKDERTIVAFKL